MDVNIVHGKHTFNFTEIYNMLKKKKLSFKAKNFSELKKIIFKLLIKKQNNNKKDKINLKKLVIIFLIKILKNKRVLI